MKTHELKIWPEYFEAVLNKTKTFEIRKNDRDFKIGDVILLKEWESLSNNYTGREISCEITYITNFAQVNDNVVMSVKINNINYGIIS